MVNQRGWRTAGVVVLAAAGLMAWYAADSGLLRDTALRLFGSLADKALETPSASLGFVLVYWGIFAVVILVALYLALIDVRYIRLRHALERRELVREASAESPAENASAPKSNGEES